MTSGRKYLLPIAFAISFLIMACDGGSSSPPDADLRPDAFSCSGSLTACGMTCVNTDIDDLHCGGCNAPCVGAESCQAGVCTCPPSFIPDTLDAGLMEMVRGDFLPGSYVAIYPFFGTSEIDVVAIGYEMTGTQLGTPYMLTATLADPPFVGSAYDVDIQSMEARAAFYATAGTLTFDTACSVGTTGTLTNATFQQVTDLMNPMIDPDGCSFTLPTMAFNIGMPCPLPPPP